MRAVLFILLILLVMLPLSAQAQAQYGLLAGWSRTDWDLDSSFISGDPLESKNGFQAGLFLEGRISGLLGMRTELLYVRKGAKRRAQAVDENGESQGEVDIFFNADYVQIPLLFTLDFSAQPVAVRPRIFFGPYLAGKVSSKVKVKGNPSNPYLSAGETDLAMEGTDLGLVFGFGVDFKSGSHPLLAQVRYDLGLTDVYNGMKNQGLTIMAGYGF